MTQLRVFNNGGGVQSTAALVLAARGEIDFHIFIHANVGADSENPDTVRYINEVHKPFAAAHGIEFIEIAYTKRDGSQPTLLDRIHATPNSVPIPMMGIGGMPLSRTCTADYKIRPIAKWLKRRGATAANPAMSGLGISVDEFQRMRTDSGIAWQRLEYPLIDLRLTRDDCKRIVAEAGLPPAPKSSCWFCPFHRRKTWQEMHDRQPELFTQAVEIERYLSAKSTTRGKPPLFLTGYAIPLDQVIAGNQSDMFDDNCESGYCHT